MKGNDPIPVNEFVLQTDLIANPLDGEGRPGPAETIPAGTAWQVPPTVMDQKDYPGLSKFLWKGQWYGVNTKFLQKALPKWKPKA